VRFDAQKASRYLSEKILKKFPTGPIFDPTSTNSKQQFRTSLKRSGLWIKEYIKRSRFITNLLKRDFSLPPFHVWHFVRHTTTATTHPASHMVIMTQLSAWNRKATDYLTCSSSHCASKPILQQQVVQNYKVTSLCLKTRSQVIKMSNKFAGNLQGFSSVCVCVSTFCNHSPLPPNHPAPDKMLNMKRINLVGSEWGKLCQNFISCF